MLLDDGLLQVVEGDSIYLVLEETNFERTTYGRIPHLLNLVNLVEVFPTVTILR